MTGTPPDANSSRKRASPYLPSANQVSSTKPTRDGAPPKDKEVSIFMLLSLSLLAVSSDDEPPEGVSLSSTNDEFVSGVLYAVRHEESEGNVAKRVWMDGGRKKEERPNRTELR